LDFRAFFAGCGALTASLAPMSIDSVTLASLEGTLKLGIWEMKIKRKQPIKSREQLVLSTLLKRNTILKITIQLK
jgi:hypothetical protein